MTLCLLCLFVCFVSLFILSQSLCIFCLFDYYITFTFVYIVSLFIFLLPFSGVGRQVGLCILSVCMSVWMDGYTRIATLKGKYIQHLIETLLYKIFGKRHSAAPTKTAHGNTLRVCYQFLHTKHLIENYMVAGCLWIVVNIQLSYFWNFLLIAGWASRNLYLDG